jgi:hypothetical protein
MVSMLFSILNMERHWPVPVCLSQGIAGFAVSHSSASEGILLLDHGTPKSYEVARGGQQLFLFLFNSTEPHERVLQTSWMPIYLI